MSVEKPIPSWQKIEIKEHILQYYFVNADVHLSNSIFVFVDPQRQKALLIDSAYPKYAEIVKEDLQQQGIEAEILIFSHYHPDHTAGAEVFKGCRIYASRYYEDNHFNCQRWEPEFRYLKPTNLLSDGDRLTFGPFHFSFIHAPGHSKCGLLIDVNHQLLHVGDLIMFDENRRCTLPYIASGGSFKEHIQSLERIKNLNFSTVVMPHGTVLQGKPEIDEEVDIRLYYLKKVFESQGNLPLSDCLKKDESHYSHLNFHEQNQVLMMLEL